MGVLTTQLQKISQQPEYVEWKPFFEEEMAKEYFQKLDDFVTEEYQSQTVYPPQEDLFSAFKIAPSKVKAIILGQDPYHGPNQAMGLSFSVRVGVTAPPSLKNIQKELESDIGGTHKKTDLSCWVEQGVFLLNTVLTVRQKEPASHAKKGWETFTKAAIEYVLHCSNQPIVAILWGKPAQAYESTIISSGSNRFVIKSVHPSPLSASRGFFGSKPFSQANELLKQVGSEEINWSLEL